MVSNLNPLSAAVQICLQTLGSQCVLCHLLLAAPSRAGRRAFAAASPYIICLYVLWLLDGYAATALDGIVTPPPVLQSIGVWGYRQSFPALLPLLLHLLTTVAIAGLSRNQQHSHATTAGQQAGRGDTPPPANTDMVAAADDAGSTAGGVTSGVPEQAVSSTPFVTIPDRGDFEGSSPLGAAGRELRHLVAFGARMSYTEGTWGLRREVFVMHTRVFGMRWIADISYSIGVHTVGLCAAVKCVLAFTHAMTRLRAPTHQMFKQGPGPSMHNRQQCASFSE